MLVYIVTQVAKLLLALAFIVATMSGFAIMADVDTWLTSKGWHD